MKRNADLLLVLMLLALACGCASRQSQQAQVAAAHQAGLDAAFDLMEQSGIAVIRMDGPFLRPVILWRDGLTLAQALVEAGYQPAVAPARILLQHGPVVEPVESARLLAGEDVPLRPGTIVRALP